MGKESKSLNTYVLDVLGCKVNPYDARQVVPVKVAMASASGLIG